MESRKMLTTQEVANYLGLSIQTINKMRAKNQIPYFRPEGTRKFLFNKEKIDLWIHNEEIKNLQKIDNQTEVKSLGE